MAEMLKMTWVDPSPLINDLFDAFTLLTNFSDLTAIHFAMCYILLETVVPCFFFDATHLPVCALFSDFVAQIYGS